MNRKSAFAIALCAILLTGCAKPVDEGNTIPSKPASPTSAAISTQATESSQEATSPTRPSSIPAAPTEHIEVSLPEETAPPAAEHAETVTSPTEESTSQPSIPVEENHESTTPVIETTEPVDDIPSEPTSSEPTITAPTTAPDVTETTVATESEAIKQPVPDHILRDLEAFGRSYAVSTYGYEVDISMGFDNSAYYPGMWGWFTASDYSQMQSLVRDAVDITTENLIARSGPIWGYREDNGAEWHTRINVTIVDDGDGMYTCWVFYG